MWASLTAIFVVVLFLIVGTVVYLGANLVAFLQPILIPVAISAILAYLLDPVVTYLASRGFGRGRAVLIIFLMAFVALVALGSWIEEGRRELRRRTNSSLSGTPFRQRGHSAGS